MRWGVWKGRIQPPNWFGAQALHIPKAHLAAYYESSKEEAVSWVEEGKAASTIVIPIALEPHGWSVEPSTVLREKWGAPRKRGNMGPGGPKESNSA